MAIQSGSRAYDKQGQKNYDEIDWSSKKKTDEPVWEFVEKFAEYEIRKCSETGTFCIWDDCGEESERSIVERSTITELKMAINAMSLPTKSES